MKVKVGQWVRSIDGFIVRVITNMNEFIIYKDINGIERGLSYKKITAVADTPQELVQVGDLVVITEKDTSNSDLAPVEYIYINDSYIEIWTNLGMIDFSQERITAIYTPDSNGNYIKQWRK